MKKILIIVALLTLTCGNVFAISFGDWAATKGLTGTETLIDARTRGITSLVGLANNYNNLETIYLAGNNLTGINTGDFAGLNRLDYLDISSNQISSIEQGNFQGLSRVRSLTMNSNQLSSIDMGDFDGLNNLTWLYLIDNNITYIEDDAFSNMGSVGAISLNENPMNTLNLTGADFSTLWLFQVKSCPIEQVILSDAVLKQKSLDVLMTGWVNNPGSYVGIADLEGVTEINFHRTSFAQISSLTSMYTMDDLQRLILSDTTSLAGQEVVSLTQELDSLNYLDVTGIWNEWDSLIQTELYEWNTLPENTLVIPEPSTLALLALGGLALRKRK